mmetsp:Transcript_17887/g.21885  ORF Transcript_17887/g.21885 Transcript_17887/m.21885 type:complete len:95 (-) Transcript_17887:1363-1647(-)
MYTNLPVMEHKILIDRKDRSRHIQNNGIINQKRSFLGKNETNDLTSEFDSEMVDVRMKVDRVMMRGLIIVIQRLYLSMNGSDGGFGLLLLLDDD